MTLAEVDLRSLQLHVVSLGPWCIAHVRDSRANHQSRMNASACRLELRRNIIQWLIRDFGLVDLNLSLSLWVKLRSPQLDTADNFTFNRVLDVRYLF